MIAQLIQHRVQRRPRRQLERIVKVLVGRLNAQLGVQHQQWVAHRADDIFGKRLGVFGLLLGLL